MTRYAPILQFDKSEVKGLFITDLHYPHNHRNFIRELFKKEWDFVLIGGDITEGTTLLSPGASLTAGSEREAIAQFEKDIALLPRDVKKYAVLGNHDVRAMSKTGQDICIIEKSCDEAGIDLTHNHLILPIKLKPRKADRHSSGPVFKILMSHGYGRGSADHTPLNTLKRLRETIDNSCDLYLCGHYHKYAWMSDDVRSSVILHGKVAPKIQSQLLGTSGSPMKWEDSYAEGGPRSQPFKSCSVGALEIHLSARKNSASRKSIHHVPLYVGE